MGRPADACRSMRCRGAPENRHDGRSDRPRIPALAGAGLRPVTLDRMHSMRGPARPEDGRAATPRLPPHPFSTGWAVCATSTSWSESPIEVSDSSMLVCETVSTSTPTLGSDGSRTARLACPRSRRGPRSAPISCAECWITLTTGGPPETSACLSRRRCWWEITSGASERSLRNWSRS
jgi:hypothetical protein